MGVDISGRNPVSKTGEYFRSSWWGWRPIIGLSKFVSEEHSLDIDFRGWGSNDGRGLKTEEECNKLADALEPVYEEIFNESEVDELQICLGSWVDLSGRFITDKVYDELGEQFSHGDIITSPLVLDDGTVVKSAHSIDKEHLKEFIVFLRECGGFEIW